MPAQLWLNSKTKIRRFLLCNKLVSSMNMLKSVFLCLSIYGSNVNGIDYENEFGKGYGQDWVLVTDANGDVHYVDLSQLPSDQSRMLFGDVYFHLYTRRNPDDFEELLAQSDEDARDHSRKNPSNFFDYKNNVKFVTHGWMSNGNDSVVTSIKDAYLRFDDLNIIGVDWQEIANNILYPWAAFSTRYVGRRVADMIDTLNTQYEVTGDRIHLIGHSLGAHVMGYAGSFSSENISRITGLDPARPFFEIPYFGPSFSLDTSDADFVDVLHTCGGILGYRNPTGHADFFPNSGRAMQPGCSGIQPILEACSHGRAFELFAESIEKDTEFWSYPCDSWENYKNGNCTQDPVLMGDKVQDTAQGSYYLYTNSEPKYAIARQNNN